MYEVCVHYSREVSRTARSESTGAVVLHESILNALEGNSIPFSACKDVFIEMSDSREAHVCDAYQFSTHSL